MKHFRRVYNGGVKIEGVGVHALNNYKIKFLRIIDLRMQNLSNHPHLYKQQNSRTVKALKRDIQKLHSKYVLILSTKHKIASSSFKIYVSIDKFELPTFDRISKVQQILINQVSHQFLVTLYYHFF